MPYDPQNQLLLGSWNIICQRCGFKYKAHQVETEWTGLLVCKGQDTNQCWEPRNPQDLRRPPRIQRPLPWTRPEPADVFVFPNVELALSGVSGTGGVGSLASSLSIELSGLAGTGSPGSLGHCTYSTDITTGIASAPYMDSDTNYLYVVVSTTDSFRIYDLTDPTSISLTSATSVGAGKTPIDVAVSGNYAYIAYAGVGLEALAVWDISDRSAPTEVGSVSLTGGSQQPIHVVVSGNYAYVSFDEYTTTRNLSSIDISNPTAPVVADDWAGNGASGELLAGWLAISGDYLYVCEERHLYIISITNPLVLSTTGTWDSTTGNNHLYGVAVSGNYAYVGGGGSARLYVIDVTNKASPTLAGSVSTGTGASNGGYPLVYKSSSQSVYIGNYNGGVLTGVLKFDVSNPGSPSSLGLIYNSGGDGVSDVLIRSDPCSTLILATWSGSQGVFIRGNS